MTAGKRTVALSAAAMMCAACGGAAVPKTASGLSEDKRTEAIFDMVAPSIVAIVNDDEADREQERKDVESTFGDEPRAPKRVIDVTPKRAQPPHGTGFMIEGGQIVTAAHVIHRPDRLK